MLCADWKQEYGGYTSYIAKGEDEEVFFMTCFLKVNLL